MRFLRRIPAIIAASTALLSALAPAAMAAVVKAPGGPSSPRASSGTRRAFRERSLEGEGWSSTSSTSPALPPAVPSSTAMDCELAFSGMHESFSPAPRRWGRRGRWRSRWAQGAASERRPADPKASRTARRNLDASWPTRSPVARRRKGSTPAASEPSADSAVAPSSLTTEDPPQQQSFVPPTICIDSVNGCDAPTNEPADD